MLRSRLLMESPTGSGSTVASTLATSELSRNWEKGSLELQSKDLKASSRGSSDSLSLEARDGPGVLAKKPHVLLMALPESKNQKEGM